MAAQVVKEDLLIVTLLLLVVNVHVPSWWRTRGDIIHNQTKIMLFFFFSQK